MRTKEQVREMIDLAFPDWSSADKKRTVDHLFEQERRLSIFRSKIIKPYKDALTLTKPFVDSEIRKISGSRASRSLKQKIVCSAIEDIFTHYTKTAKTLGGVWDKLNNREVVIDGKKYFLSTKDDHLFIKGESLKRPLKYKRRSLQPFIDKLK